MILICSKIEGERLLRGTSDNGEITDTKAALSSQQALALNTQGLEGEEEATEGRACATCDAFFYKERETL